MASYLFPVRFINCSHAYFPVLLVFACFLACSTIKYFYGGGETRRQEPPRSSTLPLRQCAFCDSCGTCFLFCKKSSLVEGFKLENSHGSVHDDGLAGGKSFLLLGGGGRAVVESHPSVGDGIEAHNLGVGILGEGIGDHNIDGEEDLLSGGLGLGENLLGGFDEVILNERCSNIEALGLQEGEDHASSDDDLITLVDESFKDGDLGRDLGSTNDGGHGFLSSPM